MQTQSKILDYFSLLKKRSIVGKSYLFIADDFSCVKAIAKLINCTKSPDYFCGSCWDCVNIENSSHPDLFRLKPETLTITIENIKEAQQFLRLKSFRAQKKILVIYQAQSLGEASANAFLKTLEEPPKNSFIAICASSIESVIPTISSRCSKVFLPAAAVQEKNADFRFNEVLSFLRGERPVFKDRKDFLAFILSLALALRGALFSSLARSDSRSNGLYYGNDYEIIFNTVKIKNVGEYTAALKQILEIYTAGETINENLALNLIKDLL